MIISQRQEYKKTTKNVTLNQPHKCYQSKLAFSSSFSSVCLSVQESERKAYNPRPFCKTYTMDKQPLNTGEQKDMTEFFTDLITKIEEMSQELVNMHNSSQTYFTTWKILQKSFKNWWFGNVIFYTQQQFFLLQKQRHELILRWIQCFVVKGIKAHIYI